MSVFFKQFCKNPKEVGSLVPSSRFFINNFLSKINFDQDLTIAEFGTWPGNFTSSILSKISNNSKLYSFEVSEELFFHVKDNIDDPRLILINDGAEKLLEYTNWNKVDIIISALPLASLPDNLKSTVLDVSYEWLKTWWYFMQYQYFLSNKEDIKTRFWDYDLFFEPLNIPPAFYYKCKKK